MNKIQTLKNFFRKNEKTESENLKFNSQVEPKIIEQLAIKEEQPTLIKEKKLAPKSEFISVEDDSALYNNFIFDSKIYNAKLDIPENFVKNRKSYLLDSRQTTFVGIPEFDEMFNQIVNYTAKETFHNSKDFYGKDSEMILANGKECQVSSSFNIGEMEYSRSETIRRLVSIDFANEKGFASGIDFELLDMDWEILTPNSDESKFAKLTTVNYPRYTFNPTIKFYLNKKLLGICFIKSNDISFDHHGNTVYKKTYTGIFNCLPINKKTLVFDNKLHYFKRYTSCHSNNNFNPLSLFGNEYQYFNGVSNKDFVHHEISKDLSNKFPIGNIKTVYDLQKYLPKYDQQNTL